MEWVNELAAWAWARHHNILSWYIRPLFLLPFCFFAYRRSLLGIGLTVVALATSMAWFPAPVNPSPAVVEMLDAERNYLFGPWDAAKVFASLLVPAVLHRSGPDLLAPVAGLGVGGDQRCGVVQDRLDVRGQRHRRRERAPAARAGWADHGRRADRRRGPQVGTAGSEARPA